MTQEGGLTDLVCVAENSSVCRTRGRLLTTAFRLAAKPRSRMRSASSSTRICQSKQVRAFGAQPLRGVTAVLRAEERAWQSIGNVTVSVSFRLASVGDNAVHLQTQCVSAEQHGGAIEGWVNKHRGCLMIMIRLGLAVKLESPPLIFGQACSSHLTVMPHHENTLSKLRPIRQVLTCTVEHSKPAVSSICCSSRPGVATKMFSPAQGHHSALNLRLHARVLMRGNMTLKPQRGACCGAY